MEDKNIILIKKIFEDIFKGLTCKVSHSDDFDHIRYVVSASKSGWGKMYNVHINEPHRIFFNPYDFEGEYKFYKDDKVIFCFKHHHGASGFGYILKTIMPHLRFNITLNHDLIRILNNLY